MLEAHLISILAEKTTNQYQKRQTYGFADEMGNSLTQAMEITNPLKLVITTLNRALQHSGIEITA